MNITKENQMKDLICDLFWEYQRMSSSGKATLDKLAKMNGMMTDAEAQAEINLQPKREHISTLPMEEKEK